MQTTKANIAKANLTHARVTATWVRSASEVIKSCGNCGPALAPLALKQTYCGYSGSDQAAGR